MKNQNKKNLVIFVSILNVIGFIMQLIFSSIAASNSSDDLLIIASNVLSFVWVSAFTVKALRHSEEPYYPAVAVTVMAWPSYCVILFACIYFASYLGFKVT